MKHGSRFTIRWGFWAIFSLLLCLADSAGGDEIDFRSQIAPILQQNCLKCHRGAAPDGEVSLERRDQVLASGHGSQLKQGRVGQGRVIVPGDPDASLLLEVVSGDEPRMPEGGPALAREQVELLRAWISQGADWPDGLELTLDGTDWWSLSKLSAAPVPVFDNTAVGFAGGVPINWVQNPIDAFVLARLVEHGLTPSPQADKRTLIRRLYYDLHGLPPTPEQVQAFMDDPQPDAYAKLVDQLLDSPRYGERWARHWLDVVHYADTHGYDKDKIRPNAWPYRDYVIRALNEDKPYAQFVREQVAGDVLADDPADGIPALGFLAAGPFDWVGQIEVSESTMEGQRVRNLDRDDMVSSVMNTFASATAQCARCHNHKFDPITQEDYYRLQAVFAAVDRADRDYQPDKHVALRRIELLEAKERVRQQRQLLEQQMLVELGGPMSHLSERVSQVLKAGEPIGEKPEFGYHSQISQQQDTLKWVQIDLGEDHAIDSVLLFPCHDTFNNIGAGFGFPVRYKIEVSSDADFVDGATTVADLSDRDRENPGIEPQAFSAGGVRGRFVRVTAVRLAPRQNDFILALGEVSVLDKTGTNIARGKLVSALDSIEAPVRWQRQNLVDGYYYGQHTETDYQELTSLLLERSGQSERLRDSKFGRQLTALASEERDLAVALGSLPPVQKVYAAATEFAAQGNFRATGGKPRDIYVLKRGEESLPDKSLGPVGPGALSVLPELGRYFEEVEAEANEAAGRSALAKWLTDEQNPLVWRSIVNRIWSYHFGRGIVDTANDFGRMGGEPSHPELLDYLAIWFRDSGGSFKELHRQICTSSTYQQAVTHNEAAAKVDAENRMLWRANRQRLDAESIRDTALMVSGKLDLSMGGPGYWAFGFKDDHSPHYDYGAYDPDADGTLRRSIYRFIVRSVPDPLMTTLDCADPTISVPKRSETLTSLQALAMMNDAFMVRIAEHFAARVEREVEGREEQVKRAYVLALQREPTDEELTVLINAVDRLGMQNVCRLILNLNEFVFID